MRDSIGNKIMRDDLVNWNLPKDTTRLLGQVVSVQDGGFKEGTEGGILPAFIQVLITIPIKTDDPLLEPTLGDFFCLRNPQSEALMSAVVGGQKPS